MFTTIDVPQRKRRSFLCRYSASSADGDIGASDPGAMGLSWRDREQQTALDPGQLLAALVYQPVAAVAEQDQVSEDLLISPQ